MTLYELSDMHGKKSDTILKSNVVDAVCKSIRKCAWHIFN